MALATEPIGYYEAMFTSSSWPSGLLEHVLMEYARHFRLTRLRAFTSATTEYGRLVCQVRWRHAGVSDALLLMPEPARGAMVELRS